MEFANCELERRDPRIGNSTDIEYREAVRASGSWFELRKMSEHRQSHEGVESQRALLAALAFTTFFAVVEALAGWWSNSLALIGDAGHMITDSLALALGAGAAWLSRRPPSVRHSYGFKRAEVLGALLNVVFMIAVIAYIGVEAVRRLASPQPVDGPVVMLVAAVGLLVNLGAAWVLQRGEQNLNVRAAMLHVFGDLLGSLAALAAGAVIWLTGWYPIDPILSVFIGVLILVGSVRLLRDVVHIVMEGVPRDVDLEKVGNSIAEVANIAHVHDLHIWALDSATYAVSAHVVLRDMEDWSACRRRVEDKLAAEFRIAHSTLQPEVLETFERECEKGDCGPTFSSRGWAPGPRKAQSGNGGPVLRTSSVTYMAEVEAPKIQFLYFDGCPLADGARNLLKKALAQCGLEKYEEIDVQDSNAPAESRLWGSPTILVDGNDATGAPRGDSVACRVYATADRLPDLNALVKSIREAQKRRSVLRTRRAGSLPQRSR